MFLFSSVVYLRTHLLPKEIYPRKSLPNLRQLIVCRLPIDAVMDKDTNKNPLRQKRFPEVLSWSDEYSLNNL